MKEYRVQQRDCCACEVIKHTSAIDMLAWNDVPKECPTVVTLFVPNSAVAFRTAAKTASDVLDSRISRPRVMRLR